MVTKFDDFFFEKIPFLTEMMQIWIETITTKIKMPRIFLKIENIINGYAYVEKIP